MTANVGIVISRRADVLKIQNAALRFRPPEAFAVRTNEVASSVKPRSASGKSSPGSGSAASGLARAKQTHRTVYTLAAGDAPALKPVQIKTGISDGIFTEVLEGLDEGAVVIVGLNTPRGTSATPAGKTPFGTRQK